MKSFKFYAFVPLMRVRCKIVHECEQFSFDASAAFVSNVYLPLRAEDKVCRIKFLFFFPKETKKRNRYCPSFHIFLHVNISVQHF